VSQPVLELIEGATRMSAAKIRWAACVVALCGAVALGGWWAASGEEPPKPPPAEGAPAPTDPALVAFDIVTIDANDLVDAHTLNIYKFKVDVPKGQKFRVILRELPAKDAEPHVLTGFSFQRGDGAGPVTMRVDFTRMDGTVGGVLLTEQKEAQFRVNC